MRSSRRKMQGAGFWERGLFFLPLPRATRKKRPEWSSRKASRRGWGDWKYTRKVHGGVSRVREMRQTSCPVGITAA